MPEDASHGNSVDYPYIWSIGAAELDFVDLRSCLPTDQDLPNELTKLPPVLLTAVADPIDSNYAHAVVRVVGSRSDHFAPSPFAATDLVRTQMRLYLATRLECYHAA